ncbi:hypothetical protein DGo_CA2819 [Deinococcus gobiensis I-0]|uniref:Uncharacterized protein n=1 Tax=Deinococcus gobiensis (strain DSM 21396 / JCM 16679 / CGMCC 1.7299 / I-0) TaxID=745776 RepID=H8GV71_DEIGI|nr:hypothetical protein DGo_CA2819 [Deinococcus gobiensis I-0]
MHFIYRTSLPLKGRVSQGREHSARRPARPEPCPRGEGRHASVIAPILKLRG